MLIYFSFTIWKFAFSLSINGSCNDRNGTQALFASRGFLLTDGIDTVYAEAVGDHAKSIANVNYAPGSTYRIQMQVCVREWKDKDGATHYSNDVRIVKIG